MTSTPEHHDSAPHLSEPPTRRIHQYGLMVGLAVLVVVFAVWLIWAYGSTRQEAQQNAAAAGKLCRQLNNVGQPCATRAAGGDAVSGDAQLPAPTASLQGSALTPGRRSATAPLPTDENGIPQAFQPAEGALIISVTVQDGRLILAFDDGARLDAGAVNEARLAIVLQTVPSISPSPSPSPVVDSATPSQSEPPSDSPSPEESPS